MGGCSKTEESNRQGYKHIIDCIKLGHHKGTGKQKKEHHREEVSWGAPADSETNKILEEIEEKLREEED